MAAHFLAAAAWYSFSFWLGWYFELDAIRKFDCCHPPRFQPNAVFDSFLVYLASVLCFYSH